ncbi:hypothetical protein [Bacillus sp. USDA818B3_A]|uniref:hypothetical protein n=1 Tax=Bacillus sp. USDA818B3_A TaxID=2698834 RepID=UPI00136DD97C|nr:hypothetical protein [Bacillus sp. USDA818B3_A]
MKKGIFWGALIASIILVINIVHSPLRGIGGLLGHGGNGFASHHMMHHGGEFSWFSLIIGLVVLVLLVKWLKKKSKASSMQQFINTSTIGTHLPVTNKNASVLDQWEKNILTKKENE